VAGRDRQGHGREESEIDRLEKRTLRDGRLRSSIMDGEIVVQAMVHVNHVLSGFSVAHLRTGRRLQLHSECGGCTRQG